MVPLERADFRRERLIYMKGFSVLSGNGQNVCFARRPRGGAVPAGGADWRPFAIGLILVHHGGNGAGTVGSVATKTATATPVPPASASVYVAAHGDIYRFDAKTGKLLWSYPVGINDPPVVVAVGSTDLLHRQPGWSGAGAECQHGRTRSGRRSSAIIQTAVPRSRWQMVSFMLAPRVMAAFTR